MFQWTSECNTINIRYQTILRKKCQVLCVTSCSTMKYISDVTFFEFYILIIIIIIKLTSFVYSKQFNNCTCYVDKIRSEREIDSTRIWTKNKSKRRLYFIQLNIAIQTDRIILLSDIVQSKKRIRAWKTKNNKNKLSEKVYRQNFKNRLSRCHKQSIQEFQSFSFVYVFNDKRQSFQTFDCS